VEAQVAGSGIGLSVVRDLVARHGGSARVEGSSRGGARVVIELPRAALGAAEAHAPSDTCVS
jgi:signal transduction histidine kinase